MLGQTKIATDGEICDSRMRMLCKAKRWIDKIRLKIIKRHYGIKNGW